MSNGILKTESLEGTSILIVQEAKQVRLTRDYRTTLGQGIFLVPRWIPAPKYELEKFSRLSPKELKAKGIIKRKGVFYLLIYQQVADLDHLLRQQEHILFDGVRMKIFNLRIKPYIVERKKVTEKLIERRKRQLQIIRESRLIPMLKRLAKPEGILPWEFEGMIRYLDKVIAELDKIIERPLVPRRKRAQGSLRAVQRQLRKRNFYLARKRLEKALENLAWPKENT